MRTQNNYFTMPNEVFQLGLSAGELAVYSYLRRCEGRRTHQCWPSYRNIGSAVGMSENTVRKYVLALEERGLIVTEPTDVRLKAVGAATEISSTPCRPSRRCCRTTTPGSRVLWRLRQSGSGCRRCWRSSRRRTCCEPPVRPCVGRFGTRQGPSPSWGFWAVLGRF